MNDRTQALKNGYTTIVRGVDYFESWQPNWRTMLPRAKRHLKPKKQLNKGRHFKIKAH